MKEENIGVLSAGERFGFKGFEWIVLDNNVDGGVLAIMASAWNNEEYLTSYIQLSICAICTPGGLPAVQQH